MDKKQAQKLLEINKQTYNEIADHFSKTRQKLWPELASFAHYIKENQKIIDLGCGNGRVVELFKDKQIKYRGLDFSKELIKRAQEKYPQYQFQVGDILDLPFNNNVFDLALSIAVLHHIPPGLYRKKAITEMKRILKPDAIAIVSVWNLNKQPVEEDEKISSKDILKKWGQEKKQKRYYHIFDKTEFKELFKDFEVVEEKYTDYNYWLVVKKN